MDPITSGEEATTICAISTYPQNAAIGIVRVSGPIAKELASALFRAKSPVYPPFPPARLILGSLVLPSRKQTVPDCLLASFEAPRSYTGEDLCELHLPGNAILLAEVLEELIRLGCRPADRGEFTRRAWEHGRIDLPAAELLNELIRARTREGMLLAASQMNAGLSSRIERIREALVEMSATLEATIEFGETDGIPLDRREVAERLRALAASETALAETFSAARSIREGCRIVIAGKANVGKSTLFNYLAGSPRAIVHASAGTTRDILKETVEIDGLTITLHDTAGLRAVASEEVEAEGLRRSRKALEDCDGVIAVFDRSVALEPPDRDVLETASRKAHLLVLNKIDLGYAEWGGVRMGDQSVEISLLDGTNCDQIRKVIARTFGGAQVVDGPLVMTLRQKRCLRRSAAALTRSAEGLQAGQHEEVAAEELREALAAIAELTGEIRSRDVIDRIFAGFCIGK